MTPEEAIETIKIAITEVEWNYPMDYAVAFETAIEALENQATSEWIPCSERLPDNAEHDWVLAQMQGDDGFMCIPYVMEYRQSKDDWYLEDAGWLKDVYSDAFKVIAWRPLPEPYKGE